MGPQSVLDLVKTEPIVPEIGYLCWSQAVKLLYIFQTGHGWDRPAFLDTKRRDCIGEDGKVRDLISGQIFGLLFTLSQAVKKSTPKRIASSGCIDDLAVVRFDLTETMLRPDQGSVFA